MKKFLFGASLALFVSVSLLNVSSNNELEVNRALAGGTCCSNDSSDRCYPTGCSNLTCSVKGAWWRSDGKPCASSIAGDGS